MTYLCNTYVKNISMKNCINVFYILKTLSNNYILLYNYNKNYKQKVCCCHLYVGKFYSASVK